jgi:hypothetical protein
MIGKGDGSITQNFEQGFALVLDFQEVVHQCRGRIRGQHHYFMAIFSSGSVTIGTLPRF